MLLDEVEEYLLKISKFEDSTQYEFQIIRKTEQL